MIRLRREGAGGSPLPRRSPPWTRTAVLAATLAIALVLVPRGPTAEAAIGNVQTGAMVHSTTGSVTATLGSASTAGDLLVATLGANANAAFGGPAGWVTGPAVGALGSRSEIWYYPNNPGGIASATFTSTAGAMDAQLSEWSGVATASPLDGSGTNTAFLNTQLTVSTSAATTSAGELGITAFNDQIVFSGTVTFTPGAGWTNLGHTGAVATTDASTADRQTGLAAGTISETETASAGGIWTGAIATFKPIACTGGSLTMTPPASEAFPAVTLNGLDRTATTTGAFAVSDMTGSGSGWNLTGTSTRFTNGGGRTLPATATTVTSASAVAGVGNCNVPTNAIGYPVTLPAGAGPPPAVKLYDAAVNTGEGPSTVTLNFRLAVPANAYTGAYTSTWTFTIASGP